LRTQIPQRGGNHRESRHGARVPRPQASAVDHEGLAGPDNPCAMLSKTHSCPQSRHRRFSRMVPGWLRTELARNGKPCAALQTGHVTGKSTAPGELSAMLATVTGICRLGNGALHRISHEWHYRRLVAAPSE
jgi:hypothetical protein